MLRDLCRQNFWEKARAEVDKIKPNTIWLAEWESPDLLVKAFDLDYSWAMHAALYSVLQGRDSAMKIRQTWEADKAKMPKNAIRMRFSDNHGRGTSGRPFWRKRCVSRASVGVHLGRRADVLQRNGGRRFG